MSLLSQQLNEKQETATATSFKLHPIVMTHKKVPHAM
jgi:hypothetical protein